jgi:uncharacterized protein (TIGR03086 family)
MSGKTSTKSSDTSDKPLNAKDFYVRCVEQATSIVKNVEPADLAKPTPDSEWSVADLLKHTLYELTWTADIVRGKTIAEVGSAHDSLVIGEDIPKVWANAVASTRKAVMAANLHGPAHLSFEDTTVEKYLWQAGGDQLIHAWDLAEGIGYVIQFDTELAQAVYDATVPQQEALAESGLFAPAIEVSENADIQTKLLALFGRNLNWRGI